jgi:hypothetical protein
MNKASGVYVGMIALFGAGLWWILQLGAALQAPENFAGLWELQAQVANAPVERMTIEQSGKFFNIHFRDHVVKLMLVESGTGRDGRTVLSHEDWTMVIHGPRGSPQRQFELSGPARPTQTWQAKRPEGSKSASAYKNAH